MNEVSDAVPRAGVLEVVNRAGHVVQRVSWDGRPLRIGRAYDNDLIVSDPFACPHHLEISSDPEGYVVRDLGSVNGTYIGRAKARIEQARLTDGTVLQFGHSLLRYHAAGGVVPPTLRDTARHGMLGRLGSQWTVATAVLVALLVLAGYELMNTAENPGWAGLARELLYPLIGMFLWAGFWSLLNRVMSHRANFHVHLAIVLLGVSGVIVVSELAALFGFAVGWSDGAWWLVLGCSTLITGLTIYAHLRYALHGRRMRLAAAAALGALLIFGTPATGDLIERNRFSSVPWLDPLLWPPGFRWVEGESVESFVRDAASLRDSVEQERAD